MSQRSEVGGCKSWPNKTKLALLEHRGLVDSLSLSPLLIRLKSFPTVKVQDGLSKEKHNCLLQAQTPN